MVSQGTEKVPGRYVDGTLNISRVAERGKQRAIGNSVVTTFCAYQCMATPCTDQKRGPKSHLLLNLIPGHHFTMFSTSLYSDVRTKEASQKRICEFFVPIQHIFKAFVCGYLRGTGKGFCEDRKGTRAVRGWYLEHFSGGGDRETESDWK